MPKPKTISDVIDSLFSRLVIGPNDEDMLSVFQRHKAAVEECAQHPTMEKMARGAALSMLKEVGRIQGTGQERADKLVEEMMRHIMSCYQIGIVLGQELQKARLDEKGETSRIQTRLM